MRRKTQLADEFVYVTRAEAVKLGLNLPSPHCDGDVYERSEVMLARWQHEKRNQTPNTACDVWPSYWLILLVVGLYVAGVCWLLKRK